VIAGIELLTSIASRDVYGFVALRGLPEAKLVADQAHLPGGIRVGPFELQSRTVTRALGPSDRRFAFAVADGGAAVADLECLPVDARSHVKELGTAQVMASEGEAQIRWLTIEGDPARLAAAVAVLRILARGPSLGAFR
ncbi:MAG: hypothetical protein HOV81_08795, partial [Kofleriaceae bacterium]|nr:hypothetical protein [Kofleriaceae bacterium]